MVKRTVSPEEAEIQNLTRQRDELHRALKKAEDQLGVVCRRGEMAQVDMMRAEKQRDELTRIRDTLARLVESLATRAHYADMYASVVEEENAALEVKVLVLEEVNDALRFQMPTYADRANRWIRGETKCL